MTLSTLTGLINLGKSLRVSKLSLLFPNAMYGFFKTLARLELRLNEAADDCVIRNAHGFSELVSDGIPYHLLLCGF